MSLGACSCSQDLPWPPAPQPYLGSPIHHQLEGCSPKVQDIPRTHSDGRVLDLAAIDKGAMGRVEVLKDEAVVRGSKFKGCVMICYTCGLAAGNQQASRETCRKAAQVLLLICQAPLSLLYISAQASW